MRSVQFGFILVLSLLSLLATARAQVSGSITSDTTWTAAASPVTVTGTVTVPAGRTLTIEPGVTVKFAAGS